MYRLKGGIVMKKVLNKIIKLSPVALVNMMAIMLVVENVNVACAWFMHQPEVPESAKKFIK